jgi:heat shock protein HslJ
MKQKYLFYVISLFTVFYFSSCTGSLFQKNAEFENKTWLLQSFNYDDVANKDGKIFIIFHKGEKKITGSGGCNTLYGYYSITGSDIKIQPGRTKMECEDTKVEDKLMTMLEVTNEFREFTSSDKDYLRLLTSTGESIEFRLKK